VLALSFVVGVVGCIGLFIQNESPFQGHSDPVNWAAIAGIAVASLCGLGIQNGSPPRRPLPEDSPIRTAAIFSWVVAGGCFIVALLIAGPLHGSPRTSAVLIGIAVFSVAGAIPLSYRAGTLWMDEPD
jgi:hypothetical protein